MRARGPVKERRQVKRLAISIQIIHRHELAENASYLVCTQACRVNMGGVKDHSEALCQWCVRSYICAQSELDGNIPVWQSATESGNAVQNVQSDIAVLVLTQEGQ